MNNNLRPDNPLKFAIAVKTEAEFMRLPKPGEKDPVFALTRSYLNMLILPCRENDFRPPVKSFVLRRVRTRKGVRLIEIASLRNYIYEQMKAEETFVPPTDQVATPPESQADNL
jgi:hypothetical protein